MKLIGIDLDGTLLSPDGTISEENRKAIYEAQNQGYTVAICTGRSFRDTEYIIGREKLDCSIISSNGAAVYHNGEFITKRTIPKESAKEIIRLLTEHGFYIEVYTTDGIILHENSEKILRGEIKDLQERGVQFPIDLAYHMIEVEFSQHGIQFVKDFDKLGDVLGDIHKFLALSFDPDKMKRINEILKERTDVSVTNSAWCNTDIGHLESNKGRGLKELANYLNIPFENVIGIGDNYNDLSMFEVSGISIAMGNADDEIKRKCTHTTLTCEENGVAHAIRQFVLK